MEENDQLKIEKNNEVEKMSEENSNKNVDNIDENSEKMPKNPKIVQSNESSDGNKINNESVDINKLDKNVEEGNSTNSLDNIEKNNSANSIENSKDNKNNKPKFSEKIDKKNIQIAMKDEKIKDLKKSEPKDINPIKKEKDEKIINNETKVKTKPVKEIPIEKKPFNEFINEHLIPELKKVFVEIDKEIISIEMKKTARPIAGDQCWVIYCEIKETCCFWLSFDDEDITSSKSFTLCKTNEKPSVLESFLIDEKKITLKLIISRIMQRLNGQKLIGAN